MPDLLDGLNANQRAVVTHPGGPLLVVAGAGTGKTLTLTRRFAWLVEQGTPAESILALTFSSPACAELRERLETLLDEPYEELNFSTFHAFCVKLLRDEALEAGVDPFLTPVTPADRLALLLDRIGELSLRHHEIRGNPAPLLASFVSRIDRLKDELISADELRAWAETLPTGTDAERAVVAPIDARVKKKLTGASGGRVRFWRCSSERAQAQAVAAEAERLIDGGVAPEQICVLVRSVKSEGAVVASALEERAIPFRTLGAAAYFQRAEVRDVLAWLRALADPGDSGAVVRALSRPPIELRSVDVARLTQLARRRKLDMPSAVAAALEGPQLSEEGRDRARAFLRLYRSASTAFGDRRPDAFVMRLIERIGLRRQQVFATHADTVERLRNIAKLPELATAYMRREPQATAREFARYLSAVAESGLREDEAVEQPATSAVPVMTMHAAKGLEFDHVFVLGLSAGAMPGAFRAPNGDVPDELLKARLELGSPRAAHEAEMRRLLHVAMTRARKGLVLAWAQTGPPGTTPRPSPFYEEARAAVGIEEEAFEEELFGPAEGLHSTFRIMRDELLDTVARVGGRLGEMRLDTYLDVDQAVARYLELIKVAALIERTKEGQAIADVLPWLNDILAAGA